MQALFTDGPFTPGTDRAYLQVMDAYQIRKARLRQLIDELFEGNTADFCRKLDEDATYISRIFSGGKPFTETIARRIEEKAGLTPLWLDVEALPMVQQQKVPSYKVVRNGKFPKTIEPPSTEPPPTDYVYIPVFSGVHASMGNGGRVEHEEVSGKHSYSQAWLLKEGLEAAQLSRIQAVGRSMEPTIWDGDMLLVNRSERVIKDGKIYAFRVGDEIRVKRLFRLMDGRVRVVSDNPDKNLYPDEHLSIDDMPEVIGRIRDRSGNTNL